MESMPAVVRTMIDLYEFTEVELSRLLRWKRFVPDDVLAIWQALHEGNSGVGLQPVSVHAFSLGAFVDFMIDRLCRYVSLDRELLQLCVRYHDHGEGLLGRDVFKHEKSSHDVEEYLATMQHFRAVFDGQVPGLIYRAYLLQHCLTNPEDFPSEARAVMAELGRIYRHEARAFRVAEELEYLLFSYRHRERAPDLFSEVVARDMPRLNTHAPELPGCTVALWTGEVEAWFRAEAQACQRRVCQAG